MAKQNNCNKCGGFETVPEGECHKCSGQLSSIIPGKGKIYEAFKKADIDINTASREEIFAITSKFPTVKIKPKDYDYICSQIATFLPKKYRDYPIVTKYIANHIYIFENHGFGNYRIIAIKKIK